MLARNRPAQCSRLAMRHHALDRGLTIDKGRVQRLSHEPWGPTFLRGRAGELIMPINLRESDRDQLFLLPPSVADWLPE
ncbi:MAG TPA: hypothetical protein VNF07_02555, partial [Acidimicrobiales bacterium]|nr:hypothetical protein [Acidimicrobiales bacterium]